MIKNNHFHIQNTTHYKPVKIRICKFYSNEQQEKTKGHITVNKIRGHIKLNFKYLSKRCKVFTNAEIAQIDPVVNFSFFVDNTELYLYLDMILMVYTQNIFS